LTAGPDEIPVAEPPGWLLGLLADAPPTRRDTGSVAPAAPAGDRPGDRFNAATTWDELLTRDGWTLHHVNGEEQHWTRPGKERREGTSATVNHLGSDVLKIFTSSVGQLPQGSTYDRFGYYTATRHRGDHSAASAELAQHQARDAVRWARNMMAESFVHADEDPPGPPRPVVVVTGRNHDELVAEIAAVVHQANTPPVLYVRSGAPTRVRADETGRPVVEPLDVDQLRLVAAQSASFVRVRAAGGTSPAPPPGDACRGVLAQPSWPFPPLAGIVELPVLRPDGTFHVAHGYDPATRLHHWTHAAYPPIPASPTADQVAAAMALVDDMLRDFHWSTTSDRANYWALLLTPIIRPLVGQVPLAVLDAPQPETGKTLLALTASTIATGRPLAMGPMPAQDEELDKRITTMLMEGATAIGFDNVDGTIRSPVLAAALTMPTWKGRVLGKSVSVEVPIRATWMATGNNIDVGGDMARRCYRIRIDPAPSGHRFAHHLEAWVPEHRVELVAALCTVVAAWWAAGRPAAPEPVRMGSYDTWAATCSGILAQIGVVGFLANQAAFRADADQDAAAWEAFLLALTGLYGDRSFTTAGLVSDLGATDGELRTFLPGELEEHWGSSGFSRRLGRALARKAGRHYGDQGLHVVKMGLDRDKVQRFTIAGRLVMPVIDDRNTAEPTLDTLDFNNGCGVSGVSPGLPRNESSGENDNGLTQINTANTANTAPRKRRPQAPTGGLI